MVHSRVYVVISGLLLALEAVLVFLSWILTVLFPEAGFHSILTGEGVRFFIGAYIDNLQSPLLLWILFGFIAWGCCYKSNILSYIRERRQPYRNRMSFRIATLFVSLYITGVLYLTFGSGNVLLGVTGHLYGSPLHRAAVPLAVWGVCLQACVYGFISGRFSSWADVFNASVYGLSKACPLVLIYLLAGHLYHSLWFVFGNILKTIQ